MIYKAYISIWYIINIQNRSIYIMPKGHTDMAKYSQISGNNVNTTEEENKTYIDLIQQSYNACKPDLHDPVQVDNAIQAYFQRCYDHNVRPGNMGVYNALGVTRQDVNDYLSGRRKEPNSRFNDTLKKIKSSMAEYRELLGSEGKISPVTMIFWQKNHDGFTDVQQVEISTTGAPEADKTAEEIAAQIEQDIPVDAEYNEV